MAHKLLCGVSIFSNPAIEPDLLANVALCLDTHMFCPREHIPCNDLTVIERGMIVVNEARAAGHAARPCVLVRALQ